MYFKTLEAKLHKHWENDDKIHIIDLPHNFYMVQFTKPKDNKHALYDGSWMIVDHYLLVLDGVVFFFFFANVMKRMKDCHLGLYP